MAKLPKKYQFIDLSDYGRPAGYWIASQLKSSSLTPIHVTTMFIIAGLIAIILMLKGYYILAAFFITFTLSLDDVLVSYFISGPQYETLPLKIFSFARIGTKPEVNAICSLMLAISIILIFFSQMILRKK